MKIGRRLRAVDLFCGAGGSSIGAENAGIEIAGAIDADPIAVATYRDNFPGASVVCDRLDPWNGPSLLNGVGPVDVLLASPECTNHSVARGARAIDEDSLRSAAFVMPFVEEWEPAYIVLENVSRMRRWVGWNDLLTTLRCAGYNVEAQLLNANDFGVPQKRPRMFVLCSREHLAPEVLPASPSPRATARSVLAPTGVFPARPIRGRKRPLASGTLKRIERALDELGERDDFLVVYYGSDGAGGWQPLDRPLRTVTTLDRFALVAREGGELTLRMLQIPELRRAMGFPEDFQLNHGARRDRIRLLGNAVCPPVMTAVLSAMLGEHSQSPRNNPLRPTQNITPALNRIQANKQLTLGEM